MKSVKKSNAKPMIKILKIVGAALGIIIFIAAIFVGVLTVTEYKPQDSEDLTVTYNDQQATQDDSFPTDTNKLSQQKELSIGDNISVVTWNIGYGSLGANVDFFMDGGDSVYTSTKEQVLTNMSAITEELNSLSPDIILLQEVDEKSSRSHKINEASIIKDELPSYNSSYAYNYKTLMVPYPIPPIGQVASGIMTLSTYPVSTACRIKLPCPFSYPIRLCNLKRCLIVSKVPIDGTNKELVIVNLHLEAYDSGEGKAAQTKMLADILQAETDKGNYVIAGGDFNQTFSNTDISAYPQQSDELWAPSLIDISEFGNNFTCITDSSDPTCRSLDKSYDDADDKFQFYVIDGFIVSSNISIKSIETVNLDFQNSDHNPIKLEVILN